MVFAWYLLTTLAKTPVDGKKSKVFVYKYSPHNSI
jgi:hypothetical protein